MAGTGPESGRKDVDKAHIVHRIRLNIDVYGPPPIAGIAKTAEIRPATLPDSLPHCPIAPLRPLSGCRNLIEYRSHVAPLPAWLPGLAFVLIWSTGFIVGKAVVPVADTSLFLLARFALAGLMFTLAAALAGAAWPAPREVPCHLLAGALMQGIYLCAGYGAVAHGLSPSVMALLGALQPLLTALLAIPLLKELPSTRTWRGLALGAAGVGLVVLPAMRAGAPHAVSPWIVLIGLLAIVSITMGTLLQKTSIANADIRASSAWQNAGAMLVAGTLVTVNGGPGDLRWESGLDALGVAGLCGAGVVGARHVATAGAGAADAPPTPPR